MPGTYTVRMTKDKQVYTTPLSVTLDPRDKFTTADRQANFDLSMKVYNLLGQIPIGEIVSVLKGGEESHLGGTATGTLATTRWRRQATARSPISVGSTCTTLRRWPRHRNDHPAHLSGPR